MIQKCSKYLVAKIFFQKPSKKMSLAELSRNANLAHTSVLQQIKILIKDKIVQKEVEIKNTRKFPIYSANTNSKEFRLQKQIHNFIEIKNSKVIEYIEENSYAKCLILFGSYQKGEATEKSDIDLFVQTKSKQINLNTFEKQLGRKIELHYAKDIQQFDEELQQNIINGIVLSGFLELTLDKDL